MSWSLIQWIGIVLGVVGSLWLAKAAAERAEKMGEHDYARKILLGAGIIFLGFYLLICTYAYNNLSADGVVWIVFIMAVTFNLAYLLGRSRMLPRIALTIVVLIVFIVVVAYFYPQIREAIH